ncbi:surface antigen repeat-containing protein [Tritrichomonas foetus]|uniref:Surface antigen repeat-containing protein n=1 Tax=Tritrichomonas foetus TaxID=1144522 RepID=A0A1J4JKC0_9EUKA|nr:surface antigen repeat-containing protein [Tritrichomonas foetus]|eukprot:OHS99586.1 surface antigen repeat-containing protein [Tritrichomonas foetus]
MAQAEELLSKIQELSELNEKQNLNFKMVADELSETNNEIVRKLEEKHKKELETCIKESNDKINKLVIENAKHEEKIKLQMQKEMVEQRRNANSDSNQAKEALKKRIYDLENNNRSLENQLKKSGISLNNLKVKLEKTQKQLEDASNKAIIDINLLKQQHENEIATLNDVFKEKFDMKELEMNELKETIEKNDSKHAQELEDKEIDYKIKLNDLYNQIDELKKQLAKSSGFTSQMHQELLDKHKKEIEELEDRHMSQIHEFQSKEANLQHEILSIQRQYLEEIDILKKEQEKEITKMKLEISKLKNFHAEEINTMKKNHESEISDLTENMKNNNKTNSELLESATYELSRLKEKLSQARSDHELQIQDMHSRKSQDIAAIHSQYKSEIEAMAKSYENKYKALEEQYAVDIDQLKNQHRAQIRQIEEKNELNLRLSIEKQNFEIEQKTSTQLALMRDEIDNEIASYRKNLESKNQEIEKLRSDIDKIIDSKDDLISKLNEQIETIKENFENERTVLIKSHKDQIELLKKEMSEKYSSSELEINNAISKYKAKIKAAKQKELEIDSQRMSQISQLKVEFEDEKEKYIKKIEELKAEILRLRNQQIDSIAELNMKEKEKDNAHKKSMEELIEKHKHELEEEQSKGKTATSKLLNQIDDLNAQLKASKDMYQKLLDEMELYANTSKKDELKKITELEKQKVADLRDQASAFQTKIDSLNEKIKYLKNTIDEIKRKNEETLIDHQEKRMQEIDQIKFNFENLIEERQKEHDQEISQLQQHIAELDVTIEEWEEKYKTRDARPEDLEKIQLLEDTVKERSDTLTKLFNELKHYQNELVNRETSYNKMFNVNPSIGELNVLERKIKLENLVTEAKTIRYLPRLTETDLKTSRKLTTPRKKVTSSMKKPTEWVPTSGQQIKPNLRKSAPL